MVAIEEPTTQEQTYYDLAYRNAQKDTRELPRAVIETMRDAIRDVVERNTVEPDHPGNLHGDDLAMFYGRLHAYSDHLDQF
jgi:hypothetical protein